MIYVNRERGAMPEFLANPDEGVEREILDRLGATSKYSQARFRVNPSYLRRSSKPLAELFRGKCAFCETQIFKSNVELFRPPVSVSGTEKQIIDGYYWLSYKWFNIYNICESCDRNKANHFPVEGKRLNPPDLETYTNYNVLKEYVASENAVLLDPCDPRDFVEPNFIYEEDGTMLPQNYKAEATLNILLLNRPSLVERRAQLARFISQTTSYISFLVQQTELIEQLLGVLDEDRGYLGLARFMIEKWYRKNKDSIIRMYPNYDKLFAEIFFETIIPNQQETVWKSKMEEASPYSEELEESISEELQYSGYLEWVEITNFKCIEHTKITFPDATSEVGENGVLLIGENGVGKSTIIQAIALVMMGNEQIVKLDLGDPKKLIRRNSRARNATVRAKLSDNEEIITLTITRSEIKSSRDNLVKPTVGIGSIRRLPERNEEVHFDADETRIRGLFRHDVVYPEIEPWMGNVDEVSTAQFDEAAKTIIDMLMIPEELIGEDRLIRRKSGNVIVNVGNGPESINEMCDGHKSVIGYALYILRVMSLYWDSALNAQGLVLIDEIGNHLHPTWKIKVISLLRGVFPRVTFVISTHDPLCLRSARPGEVWVMNKIEGTEKLNIVQKDIPPGLTLESLLTGKWFYMNHTTDDHTSKLIEEHSEQMFSENPDQTRIKEIEDELRLGMMQTPFGNTNLDKYFYLMEEVKNESPELLQEDEALKQELADRLRKQIKA